MIFMINYFRLFTLLLNCCNWHLAETYPFISDYFRLSSFIIWFIILNSCIFVLSLIN